MEIKTARLTLLIDPNKKAAFERLTDGKGRPWEAVDTAAYDDTIKLIQFVDRLRRKAA